MKSRLQRFFQTIPTIGLGLVLAAGLSGCNRDEIKVYRVAKEKPPAHPDHPGHPDHELPGGHPEIGHTPSPKISWTLPAGWTELGPSRMNVASFGVSGKSNQTAQVAITPLAGMAGKEAIIVNMWRMQVGLNELSETEALNLLSDVDIGGTPGKMFDMAGKSDTGETMRIVTAMTHHGSKSWFYKLQGDDELVKEQKSAFVAFLKSIKIEDPPASTDLPDGHPPIAANAPKPAASSMPPATDGGAKGKWPTPSAWKEVAPGSMQVAKFSVPEVDGAKADVTISVFPNSTGGNLANVNRWRGQIGLATVDESGLAALVKPLDEKIPDAILADLSNNKRRLVGAIVPAGGKWHFYKLLGDDAAVAAQKDAFIKFVKDVKY